METVLAKIVYRREQSQSASEVALLYKLAGLNRPVEDLPRMQAMPRGTTLHSRNGTTFDAALCLH